MANEKQRRRRAKEKRHTYDLVQIDSDGNETVLSASELKDEQPKSKSTANRPGKKTAPPSSRRGAPQPPSWRRVAKRTVIVVPLILVVVIILGGGKVTVVQSVVNAIPLFALFVPLSYVMDAFVYRTYQKRLAKSGSR